MCGIKGLLVDVLYSLKLGLRLKGLRGLFKRATSERYAPMCLGVLCKGLGGC